MRLIMLLLAVLAMTGCGSDQRVLAPVSGTVSYRGKRLEKGTIQFVPDKGRSANGRIEQGKIVEVSTFDRDDGAMLGNHRVVMFAFVGNPTGFEANVKWAIPKRYGSVETSGLTAEISADRPNELAIELRD